MRICSKCGAFDGDGLSRFCLADGGRLHEVDTGSDKWTEGEREIQRQGDTLRKTQRRLKWRRLVQNAVTMMVVTMVVCVTVINGVIYLNPPQEPKIVKIAKTATPDASPTPDVTDLGGLPVTDISHLDDPVDKPNDKPNDKPADKAIDKSNDKPNDEPCTPSQKSDLAKALIKSHRAEWFKTIKNNPPEVPVFKGPAGPVKGEAALDTTVTYEPTVNKRCNTASFVAHYSWQITTRFNGKAETVPRRMQKTFTCYKRGSAWRCA
ncbi:MAG TPA: hypothetical protein VN643_12245 [Pyrinomonadaceae bacterium]|nr:hypothetical protein [Pyrinomonadaceae bacterium]